MLFFLWEKPPENIATYLRFNDEELDLRYIKGAENLVVFKEKSDTPKYLIEQDNKINVVREELETSKEHNKILKDRLRSQEDRLKSIENILMRNLRDSVDPFDGTALSKDEDKLENHIVNDMILDKERKLKHLLATNPKYKDSEIFYLDRTYDDKGNIINYGNPFLRKKEKPKTMEEINNEITKAMNKDIVLNAFINLDKKKQQELIKKLTNQTKQDSQTNK